MRTPPRRRPGKASSSSYGSSAKSSLKSRRSFRFCEAEALRGPADSEAYLSSGASSTPVPRFENTSLCRKPEQGRENRHLEHNPPNDRPGPTSSVCTLSGTHPFAARASSNTCPACDTLPAPRVRITSPAFASSTRPFTALCTDAAVLDSLSLQNRALPSPEPLRSPRRSAPRSPHKYQEPLPCPPPETPPKTPSSDRGSA